MNRKCFLIESMRIKTNVLSMVSENEWIKYTAMAQSYKSVVMVESNGEHSTLGK